MSRGTTTAVFIALVERLIEDRETALEAHDYMGADRIQGQLTAAGISLEETPDGALWNYAA